LTATIAAFWCLWRALERPEPASRCQRLRARAIRRPERQVRLARLVRQPTTDVVNLDRVDATNIGRLLAASGTADITAAHVVICARPTDQPAVTSDPDDLRQLDPVIRLIPI
jgi:hypothetical protein